MDLSLDLKLLVVQTTDEAKAGMNKYIPGKDYKDSTAYGGVLYNMF